MKKLNICLALLVVPLVMAEEYTLEPSVAPMILTLPQAVAYALKHSLSLKQQANLPREAKAKVWLSAEKVIPDLSLTASHQVIPEPELGSAKAELKLPILDLRSWISIKSARENLKSSELTYNFESDNLMYDIAKLYSEALLARSVRDVALEEQEKYRKQSEILLKKARLGAARNFDINAALYVISEGQSDYVLKELAYKQKLGSLGLALTVQETFDLSFFELSSPYLSLDKTSLVTLAQSTPDIKAKEHEIRSSKYSIISESFSFAPNLFGSLESGFQSQTERGMLRDNLQFGTRFMLNLHWPLFNGGQNIATLRIAKAQKSSQELALEQKKLEKRLSLNATFDLLKSYESVYENYSKAQIAAEQSGASAERLFAQGEITALEFVEASVRRFKAKSQIIEADINIKLAKLRILFLIGKIKEAIS